MIDKPLLPVGFEKLIHPRDLQEILATHRLPRPVTIPWPGDHPDGALTELLKAIPVESRPSNFHTTTDGPRAQVITRAASKLNFQKPAKLPTHENVKESLSAGDDLYKLIESVTLFAIETKLMGLPARAGTAFCIGKNMFMTADHVSNGRNFSECNIFIRWEQILDGASDDGVGKAVNLRELRVLSRSPDFELAGNSGALDYSIFQCAEVEDALKPEAFYDRWRNLDQLTPPTMPMKCKIIGHPATTGIQSVRDYAKTISSDDTFVVKVDNNYLYIVSDTIGGNSGSPVLDEDNRLLGVYHGEFMTKIADDDASFSWPHEQKQRTIVNIASRADRIFKHWRAAELEREKGNVTLV
jgi:hypothetical protein